MGIAVTDGGTVLLSSSKEHALFSLKEEEMLGGTETLTKVCGKTAGHAYIKTLFSFAIPVTKQ